MGIMPEIFADQSVFLRTAFSFPSEYSSAEMFSQLLLYEARSSRGVEPGFFCETESLALIPISESEIF